MQDFLNFGFGHFDKSVAYFYKNVALRYYANNLFNDDDFYDDIATFCSILVALLSEFLSSQVVF